MHQRTKFMLTSLLITFLFVIFQPCGETGCFFKVFAVIYGIFIPVGLLLGFIYYLLLGNIQQSEWVKTKVSLAIILSWIIGFIYTTSSLVFEGSKYTSGNPFPWFLIIPAALILYIITIYVLFEVRQVSFSQMIMLTIILSLLIVSGLTFLASVKTYEAHITEIKAESLQIEALNDQSLQLISQGATEFSVCDRFLGTSTHIFCINEMAKANAIAKDDLTECDKLRQVLSSKGEYESYIKYPYNECVDVTISARAGKMNDPTICKQSTSNRTILICVKEIVTKIAIETSDVLQCKNIIDISPNRHRSDGYEIQRNYKECINSVIKSTGGKVSCDDVLIENKEQCEQQVMSAHLRAQDSCSGLQGTILEKCQEVIFGSAVSIASSPSSVDGIFACERILTRWPNGDQELKIECLKQSFIKGAEFGYFCRQYSLTNEERTLCEQHMPAAPS